MFQLDCKRLQQHTRAILSMCLEIMKKEKKYLVQLHQWRLHSSILQSTLSTKRQKDRFQSDLSGFISALFCPSADIVGPQNTHTATAYKDNAEALQHPSSSHHPGQSQEQDDTEDVLEAGQVYTHKRPHLGRLVGRSKEMGEKNFKTQFLTSSFYFFSFSCT